MPRRNRNYVALPRFILLVTGAAIGSRPPGIATTLRPLSFHQYPPLSAAEAVTVSSPPQSGRRRAWGTALRSWNPRRRRGIVQDARRARTASSEDRRLTGVADPAVDTVYSYRSSNKLSWVNVRGGAGTRVDVDGLALDDDSADESEESGSDAKGLGEEVGDAADDQVDGGQEDESSGAFHDHTGTGAAVAVDREAKNREGGDGEEDSQEETEREGRGKPSYRGGEKEVEAKATAAGEEAGSTALRVGLGEVVPAVMKSGVAFVLGTWLAKKLSPSVAGQVRSARIIYTAYLIFSQALCMYLRYLIWKRGDETEVAVPPPPQLKKMVEGVGGAGAAATRETAGSPSSGTASGGASPLAPMVEKLLTSKTPAKQYDMKVVQGMRRGQFWASLFMCFTHLKRGMIKPMILQVSFGVLTLLDSPLFKIYVLGREAEGGLARPFKKQGFMASLSGSMEGFAAKAEEARVAAEAKAEAEAEAATAEETEEPEDADASQGGDTEDDVASVDAGPAEDNDDNSEDDDFDDDLDAF